MGIGISLHTGATPIGDTLRVILERAHEAADAGVDTIWFSQGLDIDAITVAALVGREVPGIGIGTAAVPMYPRHPVVTAAQARTAQIAADGRFLLGIGLGHRAVVEDAFGVPFERPIRHLRDYLRILRSVFETGTADVQGPTVTARLPTTSPTGPRNGITPPIPLLVAAMGPQALRAAGELADGTLPYLAGPRTLAESIVPTIVEAARAAGRPDPTIAVGVPAAVTADIAETRAHAERALAAYGNVPSYRAVLNSEGAVHPADVALIGDEDTVAAGIRQYLDAGATDVRISPAAFRTDDDRLRTWRLAGELARGSRAALGL
ncbi:LLM class F420-dependent oxidoreductase [Frankia tisae]|uniref:LLM class F420-dependent oxidoreductase n=1 Tax=Frankia tisae TaxID=2950104 RepID=UPI0021BFCC79|nr:LLM class F420-dependent oxidoreductase [Frankia tisae]